MSDENKPHDDHGHAAGHDDHAPAPAAPDAHAAPVADAHGHDDHSAGETVAAVTDGHDHHEAAAEASDHDEPAHADPVVAVADGHDHHDAPAGAAHETPADTHDEPAHTESHPVETAAAAVGAVAGGAAVASAAAASTADRRPIWSDAGDAPFEDVDATPVYARGKKDRKKKSKGSSNEGFEIVKTIVFALLIALVLRVLLFQPFTIPSASMEPNLYEGDYIVVSKWSYGYSRHSIPFSPPLFKGRILDSAPKRGDIVVFKLPRDNRTDYIKRVIGLPGDRVQMINNVLHINGAPVRDVVVTGQDVTNMYGMPIIQADETLPEGKVIRVQDFGPGNDLDDTAVFEVPAGHYFMMGDNRDNSIDSRVEQSQGVGLVPEENLIGKAEIILFSWSPGASLWNPVSWFTKVRPSRFFHPLH